MTCESTALAIALLVSTILNMVLIFSSLGKDKADEPPPESLETPLVTETTET